MFSAQAPAPNNSALQRSVHYKVHGRSQSTLTLDRGRCAHVLNRRRAAAELSAL